MADDWSREEVEAAVADYFDMLAREISGVPYNKAEHNRRLQNILGTRSRGSIEFKHQNITAVLIELGFANIPGYKPRFNYQDLLRIVVEERLANDIALQNAVKTAVERPIDNPPAVSDILSILVPPPKREKEPPSYHDRPRIARRMLTTNYLETESRNRSLGLAGEEFIMQYEQTRLWRAGKRKLADQVEHVAKTKGDGFGYDIRSFTENGQERFIEVKTTRYGSLTPFFASRNEIKVSEDNPDNYQLYRLFQFSKQPQLFVLDGPLHQTCTLEPSQYSATPQTADDH